ncbi:tetratricopeptide repeat protein [Sorangium sp. So ce1000]|uniref:tetratricopeptide repeat protein n=1 Tax=Sorangium sp. So ce1000 TaxID=3133325 RepID=UPI003F62D822
MTRREGVALGGVLAIALAVRLLYLHELRGDVLFENPPLDEARYVDEARRSASGLPLEDRPFWQPPGILFVLAATFRAAGSGLTTPRLLQALAGTAACALVWLLARRLFGLRAPAAIAAAAIVALHGLLVFAGGELLPATWAGVLDLAALALLRDAPRSVARAAAAGGLLGVSALFTPVILPFAAIAAIALARTRERRAVPWVFAAAVLAPLVPVAVRNTLRSGELVLISTNGGLNFFLGNNERYLETLAIRPGPRWTELTQEPWSAARISAPGAASSWFFRRGLAFWAAHPLDALGLYLRKLWLFFHAVEIPRDTDLYAVRSESRVLRALVGPRALWWLEGAWPDGALVPLALVGLATSLRERERLALPLAFVGSQAAVYAFFFASARYRVPCVPVLALFAVAGAASIARAARDRDAARAARAIGAAAVLAVACALPAREATMASPAERELYRGLAHRRLDAPERAIEHFRRAAQADPDDPRPWLELGNALDAVGRPVEAADAWERAAARDPWDLRPGRQAAAARARAGDRAGAIRALEANVAAGRRAPPEYAVEHMELAALHLDAGDREAALRALRAAFAASPSYARSRARELARARRAALVDPAFWAAFDGLSR